MYNNNKESLNTEERIKHQINTRKLDSDRYRRKNVTKQDSNKMSKNKKIDK